MTRVALVYDAAYPFCKGGGERRFHAVARELAARGHAADLYAMRWWSGGRSRVVDGVRVHGLCRGRSLYTRSGRRSIWSAIVFGLACLRLLRARFDVLDCSGFPYFSLFSCRLVATVRRRPLVSTWHEVWGPAYWREYLGPAGVLGALVERLAVRMPDRIIAVSGTTARRIRAELGYRGPIDVLPNGVDEAALAPAPPAAGRVDVAFAGRLIAAKQVDLLLRAIARLARDGSEVTCVVVGDGPERDRLTALARSLGVDRLVRFTGSLPDHAQVLAALRSARVFVLPSVREGFGMVVLEANACGLPVITVDHPANAATELVADGDNGWVVPNTERDLAGAIRRAVGGPPPAADIAARVAGHTWPALAERYGLTELYSAAGPAAAPAGEAACSPSSC